MPSPSIFNGIRYEVALDIIGAIISHYAEAIALERDKPQPDETAIARDLRDMHAMRRLREDLDHHDDHAIETIIAQCAPIAGALFGLPPNVKSTSATPG